MEGCHCLLYHLFFTLCCTYENRNKVWNSLMHRWFCKGISYEYFNKEELDLIEDSLKARIDVQYYVDKDISDELYSKLIDFAPQLLIKSKSILSKLTEKKINSIREEIKILITE